MPDYLTIEDDDGFVTQHEWPEGASILADANRTFFAIFEREHDRQRALAGHATDVLQSGRPPVREMIDHNFYEDDDDD